MTLTAAVSKSWCFKLGNSPIGAVSLMQFNGS